MSSDNWMMFGTFAEQRHFIYPSQDTYKGTIINGNMAAHAPGGLAGFLLEKTQNLPYIIDPLTHAFQHPISAVTNDNNELRSSIRKMANAYGSTISDRAGIEPLRPEHLEGQCLADLVENCLRFQREQIVKSMQDSDAIKYLGGADVNLSPYALVSPYFYMTDRSLELWLPKIVEAARIAVANRQENEKIFTSIVVSQEVIRDDNCISEIANAFTDINLNGYLLWIDNLDEQHAGKDELKGLIKLAGALRGDRQREVINLHGGYFSILAGSDLGGGVFSGVTHGPEFGECRSVVPVGGGIPTAKYYVPKLHARFRYRDALSVFNQLKCLDSAEVFYERICSCPECVRTIDGDPDNFALFGDSVVRSVKRKKKDGTESIVRMQFSTSEAKLRSLQHYLQRKQLEHETVEHTAAEQLLDELVQTYQEYESALGLDGVAHLALWHEIFSQE